MSGLVGSLIGLGITFSIAGLVWLFTWIFEDRDSRGGMP